MPLSDIDAHCEKHEARSDGLDAKVEKFSDEGSEDGSIKSQPSTNGSGTPLGKIIVVAVVAVVAIAAALYYLQVIPGGSRDDGIVLNEPPNIDSWTIQNNTRTPRIWVNASDPDNNIRNVTVEIARYDLRTNANETVLALYFAADSRTVHLTEVIDFNSGRTVQNESKANLDGPLLVIVTVQDDNGTRSPTLSRNITLPSMNLAPEIVNDVFVNSQNGMRVWANASDPDDAIYTVTVEIYVNHTPLGSPVLVRVYYINQSTANISDVISLGALSAGDYLIRAYAVDVLEKESEFRGFYSFSLPV
jgi:hypothetical protein